jgi:outer membrane lipoprotein carrier protein
VSRFAQLVSLLALPAFAWGAGVTELLKAVEQRYNRARTLQVLFSQTYTVQGGRTTAESGELFLRKPGRMLWRYASPQGKIFASDGKFVYLYSPSANRVEKMSLRESEDMRAPLGFLLGKLDFWRDFRKFTSRADGADVRVVADPKSSQLPYTKVEFVVTPRQEIRYLHVTGQDHSVMEFTFANEKVNPPLPETLFRFQPPPGAEIVDTSAGGGEAR